MSQPISILRRHSFGNLSSPTDKIFSPCSQVLVLNKVHSKRKLFDEKDFKNYSLLTGDEILLMHQPKDVAFIG